MLFKRSLSILLTVLMLVSVIPLTSLTAFAEDAETAIRSDSVTAEADDKAAEETIEEALPAQAEQNIGKTDRTFSDDKPETAAVGDEPATAPEDVDYTRAQWLADLTQTFGMTVDEDNYPDNYFADLSEDDDCYYDVLLAAEFGVIDVEAGGNVYPYEAADRDFVASTLNYCLGFTFDGDEYTYVDMDETAHPDDAQIAVDKGWLELTDGEFKPDQAVTSGEAEAMLNSAKAILDAAEVDENYKSTYDFADNVKVVPKGVQVNVTDTAVELTGYPNISVGDTFAVFVTDVPSVYTAEAVSTSGNITTVTVGSAEQLDEDVVSADAQGSEDVYEGYIEAAEGVEVEYEYEDDSLYTDDLAPTGASGTKKINAVNAKWGPIKVKFTNLKADYIVDTLDRHFMVAVKGDADISITASTSEIQKFLGGSGSTRSFDLLSYNVPGVGKAAITIYAGIEGTVTVNYGMNFSAGFEYTKYNGFRTISDFHKKSFSITLDIELDVGIRVGVNVDILSVVKGSVWARAGFKAVISLKVFPEELPHNCRTIKAYIYADAGFSAGIHCLGFDKSDHRTLTVFDENNSPVRLYFHYEDGEPVYRCAHGINFYTTSYSSRYGYCTYGGARSTGFDAYGKPFTIFKYSLDKENNATITSYQGNVTSLTIPSTIDGYTVTAIGSKAFENNRLLRSVTIPDTVTSIGEKAFSYCTNLISVVLSKELYSIGKIAFQYCTSLSEIEIPKSLEKCTTSYTNLGYTGFDGPFFNCSSLKTATFEEGITAVPSYVFAGSGLVSIDIPDTVTSLGDKTFSGCTELIHADLPDGITSIGSNCFSHCEKLINIRLPKSLETLGRTAFLSCKSLTGIEIPKSLKNCTTQYENINYGGFDGPFAECENLKNISFEEGITNIPGFVLAGSSIEKVVIPDTVTHIGRKAFGGCTKLVTVDMPDSVISIAANGFSCCEKLTNIKLPKELETLGWCAFYRCNSLTGIKIPKALKNCTTQYENINYGGFDGPFAECENLKNISFEEGITSIPNFVLGSCGVEELVIPDTVTIIEKKAIANCANLKKVSLPNGLESIGYCAFRDCSSLEKVIVPESVTTMGTYAFAGCSSMTTAKLPSHCKTITEALFKDCSSLKKIEYTDCLTKIDNYALSGCVALEDILLSDNLSEIGQFAYSGSGIKKIVFSKCLKSIGNSAFYDCDALTDVTLPSTLRTLGSSAFQNCEVLENVTLADYSISEIKDSAFADLPTLQKIVLPKGLTKIGNNAFKNDTKLTEIEIPESVTSIADNAFSYPAKMTIYGYTDSYAKEYADSKGIKFVDNHILSSGLALSEKFDEYNDYFVLDYGESMTFSFDFYPEDSNDVVTLKSSNNTVKVDMLTVEPYYSRGDSVITATATGGAEYEFTVHVRHVQSIDLTSLPDNLSYTTGEELDLSGLEVKVNYNDDSTAVAEQGQYTVSGYDAQKNEKQTLTVTFTAKNGSTYRETFEVEVADPKGHPTGIKIKTLPDKVNYVKRQSLDTTGLTVVQTYDSGAEEEISGYTVSGYNALRTGEQTVTVKYGDYSDTFTVTVYASEAELPTERDYVLGDVDSDGEVTAVDATYIQRYATLVKVPFSEADIMRGDVDGDGEATVVDATYIQRYATLVKVPFPIGE